VSTVFLFDKHVIPKRLTDEEKHILKCVQDELELLKSHKCNGLPSESRAMSLGCINITKV